MRRLHDGSFLFDQGWHRLWAIAKGEEMIAKADPPQAVPLEVTATLRVAK